MTRVPRKIGLFILYLLYSTSSFAFGSAPKPNPDPKACIFNLSVRNLPEEMSSEISIGPYEQTLTNESPTSQLFTPEGIYMISASEIPDYDLDIDGVTNHVRYLCGGTMPDGSKPEIVDVIVTYHPVPNPETK